MPDKELKTEIKKLKNEIKSLKAGRTVEGWLDTEPFKKEKYIHIVAAYKDGNIDMYLNGVKIS